MNSDISSNSTVDHPRLIRREFRDLLATVRWRFTLIILAMMFVLLATCWVMAASVERSNGKVVHRNSPVRWLLPASLLPVVGGFVWALDRASRHRGLLCPSCSSSLALARAPRYAMVTGRCPMCAAAIFDDEAEPVRDSETADNSGVTLINRTELLRMEESARRAAVRPTLVWGASGVAIIVLALAAADWSDVTFAAWVGPILAPLVKPLLLIPGVAVTAWSIIVWIRGQDVSLPCSHCSADITPHGIATVTGHCSTCGERVVRDPHPDLLPIANTNRVGQWSIAEFRKLAKFRRDRLWIGCFVGAVLVAPALAVFLLTFPSSDVVNSSPGLMSAYFVFIGLMLALQCCGVLLWHWLSARDLRCRQCNGELVSSCDLVVSSRRCYHCGATVISPSTAHPA